MNTKAVAALSALLLFSTSAVAQEACDPAKLPAMVDTYASNPFSARTWRALNGLGDPMIEPSYSGSDTWQNQDAWKKLVAATLPPGQAVDEVGYDCRIGYPLQVLKSRIATLGKDNPYVQQWLKCSGERFFRSAAIRTRLTWRCRNPRKLIRRIPRCRPRTGPTKRQRSPSTRTSRKPLSCSGPLPPRSCRTRRRRVTTLSSEDRSRE